MFREHNVQIFSGQIKKIFPFSCATAKSETLSLSALLLQWFVL